MAYDPCVYCGKPAQGWDHLMARAKHKGVDCNQARACKKCNGTKGTMTPLEFLVSQARKKRLCYHEIDKNTCVKCRANQKYLAARHRVRSKSRRKVGTQA